MRALSTRHISRLKLTIEYAGSSGLNVNVLAVSGPPIVLGAKESRSTAVEISITRVVA